MKTILIPSIPNLEMAKGRDYHLLLSHLCEDVEYLKFYVKEKSAGSYLILDNSAHEFQAGEGPQRLLEVAVRLQADEVVVPDYLEDADQTVAKAIDAFRWFAGKGREAFEQLDPRLMIVPQGDSFYSWRRCLHHLTEVFYRAQSSAPELFRRSPVIGVSKDYEVFDGGLPRLLEKVILPHATSMGSPIHMLGWGRRLWDLKIVARDFGPFIRTVDSAKPFVYAMANVKLDPHEVETPTYPKRPSDYFTNRSLFTREEMALGYGNIAVFDSVARTGE